MAYKDDRETFRPFENDHVYEGSSRVRLVIIVRTSYDRETRRRFLSSSARRSIIEIPTLGVYDSIRLVRFRPTAILVYAAGSGFVVFEWKRIQSVYVRRRNA